MSQPAGTHKGLRYFLLRLLLANRLPRKIIIWSRIKHLLSDPPPSLCPASVRVFLLPAAPVYPYFYADQKRESALRWEAARYKRFIISVSLALRTCRSFSKGSCWSVSSWGSACTRARDWNRLIREKMRGHARPRPVWIARSAQIDERDFVRSHPRRRHVGCQRPVGAANLYL